MSVNRNSPPTEEEIFGDMKNNEIEIGLLQMQILWILNHKPTHGYELMKQLSELKRMNITQGTLYPTLQSLEKKKLISGKEDERKIVYTITEKGLDTLNNACNDFARTFFGVFKDYVCHKCIGDKK